FLKKMYRQDKKFLANIFAKKNFQNILFQGRLITGQNLAYCCNTQVDVSINLDSNNVNLLKPVAVSIICKLWLQKPNSWLFRGFSCRASCHRQTVAHVFL
ncbi:hypothetical protein, partial [Nitrosomonas sp. Nm51]|uniref:hypothetical protein n=1 Tax=Nitrosomonas sp. Nm51 TaxID=133720 RepID=UPI001C435EE4